MEEKDKFVEKKTNFGEKKTIFLIFWRTNVS